MSVDVSALVTENLDIWSSTIKAKNSQGRGSSKKTELYGVKKLRELILELAVQGLLVPQDSRDKSANDLLVTSLESKDLLLKSGKLKPSRSKKNIKEEHFFTYPENWASTKLEDLMNVINGRAYKKPEMLSEGTPILRVGNLFTSNEWYYSDLELEEDKYIDNGDLIYAWSASFGPFLWEGGKVIYHYHIWKMDIYNEKSLDKAFSKLYLQAISERIKASGNGIAMIHMTKERMEKVVHPLPPLEEQHRIVSKVNELMTLCDQLEQQQESSITAHETLVKTVLEAVTRPTAINGESEGNATAILFEHFDTLFTTEHSINQLKQTILQLAVMGKLVPQNPNDEPASELLKKIAAEKARLVKEKKIKKQKPLPPIGEDEKPFELPEGWEWCRLGDSYYFLNGFAFKSEWFCEKGIRLLRNINIAHGKTKWIESVSVPLEMQDECKRFNLETGDIVISLDRPIINTGLKYAVITEHDLPCLLLQRVAKFHSIGELVNTEFLSRWLESDVFINSIDPGRSNGVPHISTKQLENGLFPLNSKKEQRRILDKVNELMTLCDAMLGYIKSAQTTQLKLTDAITEQAIGCESS